MPNWKKVIVSGSDAYLRNITASGDISASGLLHASLSFDTTPVTDGVVVYDTAGGRFYYTGSYGSSGGDRWTISEQDGTPLITPANTSYTTLQFENGQITFNGSNLVINAPTLDQVTDQGNDTTNSAVFLNGQTLNYAVQGGSGNATSGFRSSGGEAYTHVTPQPHSDKFAVVGMPMDTTAGTGPQPYPHNYLVLGPNPSSYTIVVDPGGDGGGGGGGGGNPDEDHPNDGGGHLIVTGKGIQIQASSSASSIEKDNKARGIYITPSALYFVNKDASASISGGLQPQSASAQIRFNTGSNSIQFLVGSTNETLKEVLFISKSGDTPRIGIGTNTPKQAFDIKEILDNDRGSELLIRSSRTTKGADDGDSAGRINFTIDSSSFGDIETSGSAAEIVSIVDQIDSSGVRGSLSFRVAAQKTAAPVEKLRITPDQIQATGSFVISGSNSFTNIGPATFSGSVAITDTLGIDGITTHNNNVVISNGLLDANDSGVKIRGTAGLTIGDAIIPGAGQLRVNDFSMLLGGVHVGGISDPGTDNLLVDGTTTLNDLIVNGTASIAYFETLYETSSIIYSSGSTKFGDTMDDFHDFTGSVDITGSIVASNLSGTNTGDQDLSSYSTIVQLNASSSALQSNIDAKASITQLNVSSSALQSNIDAKASIVQLNASSSALQSNIDAKASITQLNASSSALQSNIDTKVSNSSTASFAITGSDVLFGHLSSSHFQVGILDRPLKLTGGNSFAATRPTIEGIGGIINVDSGINITGEYKLSFDNDATNTYIAANSDNPEDLEIHADQDIILAPDNAVVINGSLIATSSTTTFANITASGTISASGTIVGSNLSGTNTGDQDLSSYSTIVQLNASSSALQTNIDTKVSNSSTASFAITGSDVTFEEITTDTISTISTVIGSDAATNVDTFNTSSYTGAIYDYTLVDTTVGARAGQFMIAQDSGSVTFTDNSTKHLFDATSPEISGQINGANVEVQVTNGNGYTFKSFAKKL